MVEGLEKAVLIEHADRNEIAGTFSTTRHINIILFLPCVVVHQVLEPVGAWINGGHIHVLPVLYSFLRELPSVLGYSFHFLSMIVSRCILVGVCRLKEFRNLLKTYRSCQCDGGLAYLAATSCNENNAVGTTYTKDGRSGSILKNRNVLHLVRVYLAELTLDTIDKYERFGAVERTDTTDADDRVIGTRNTGVLHRLETWELTRKGVTKRCGWRFEKFLTTHVGDRTRQRHLTLLAVADDNHFIKHFIIRFQNNIKRSRCCLCFFRLVADIRKHQG